MPKEVEQTFVEELCSFLLNKKLIMHNGVFDITVIKNRYGIDLTPALYADTILMKHTVDEEQPFGLKDIAILYKAHLGIPEEEVANQEQLELGESVKRNGGKFTKTQKDIYKGNVEIIGKYACADVDLTLRLYEYLQDRLVKERLDKFFYEEEVMPLYKNCTIPMKSGGIFIDLEYFKKLEKDVERGIIELTGSIFDKIRKDIEPYVRQILDEKIKETRTGKFAERVLRYYEIPIPSNKRTGKPTLAKSALQPLISAYPGHPAIEWLLHSPKLIEVKVEKEVEQDGQISKIEVIEMIPDPADTGPVLPKSVIYDIKRSIFVESHPDLPEIFNLASNDDLAWLLFQKYGEKPKKYSKKTNKPQVDKESLEEYMHLPFMADFVKLKKEEKLLNTYIKPIIETNINGWLYPSMLQFGTTSGRFSCAGGLNLQTLPRDDKRIKTGFIAPPGYKVVNADFSSLEPRIFSWVSGDEGLKTVWREGLDLYSQIAIDVFGLTDVSARESDENYLKKVEPDKRQLSKTFTLAVPYGANEYRIAGIMKVDPMEAKQIIDNYLDAYPMLREYMSNQEFQARTYGTVRTQFGRVRHLNETADLYKRYGPNIYNKHKMKQKYGDEFGELMYYKFRNGLNNSKNFPIQATAAHVCNAAMIKLAKSLKAHKIDGWISLQVHDEITCIIRDEHANMAAELLKDAMENNSITKQIDIPILAEPVIADNFAEAK